jgi:hypothetical protein
MQQSAPVDRAALHAEMRGARDDLARLLAGVPAADLRRGSAGTRWTNEQLLFHMVFGYMVVRALLPLVRVVSRLPRPVGAAFAGALDATARPFHVVNYLGTCAAALVFNRRRMLPQLDRTLASLHRSLDALPDTTLRRGMAFPPRWDPFFTSWMTVAEVVHYATQHYEFHRRQLSFSTPST